MHNDVGRAQIVEAARRLRTAEIDSLVDVSVERLRDLEPEYSSVAYKSLADQMRKNITLTLLRISGDPVPSDLAPAAYETGRLRAIQQVDLIAVSRSFRIDLRVLWEAFLRDAEKRGLHTDASYIAELLRVWEAVETNIHEMTEGYRTTAEKLKQQNNELKFAAFQRLLDLGSSGNSAAVAKQLSVLAFDPTAPFFCVVSELKESDYAELSVMQTRMASRGITSYFGWQSQHLIGLVQATGLELQALLPLLGVLEGFRTSVVSVTGPEALTAAIRNARTLVSAVDAPGVHALHDHWLEAIAYAEPTLTGALVEELFAPFRELSDYAQEELTRVIDGFFSTNGTIAATSQAIYRHRNTVRNRLLQIEQLTGLDLDRPRDAALLALAFPAWKREMAR